MTLFYIGLSRLSSAARSGGKRESLSAEGRRVLGLLDGGSWPIALEAGGRPWFPDGHADFSISHSGNMAAVSWLSGGKNKTGRTGCDIQQINPRKSHTAISRRFFHRAEQEYIAAAENTEEQARRFYRLWVLKEAWIKLYGFSVFDMGKAPLFSTGAALPNADTGPCVPLDFFLYGIEAAPAEQYMLALVRERPQEDSAPGPEIRWFSSPPPALNSIADIYAAQMPVNTVTPKM